MQIAPPGDVWSYSNLGYGLSAYLLEQRTGRPFADAMRETLFKPLGMTRTTLRPIEAMTYPFAQGHEPSPKGPVVVRPFADDVRYRPGGGVFTSAAEFARFAVALLNGGRIAGKQALTPGAIALMLGSYAEVPGTPPYQYVYGLNLRTMEGRRVLQHGGERIGFGSLFRVIPERRIGVIVLGNRTGPSMIKTLEAATAIALALPPVGPAPTELPAFPVPKAKEPQMPLIEALLGRYVNEPGKLTIELLKRDGRVVLQGNAGIAPVERLPDGRYVAGGEPFMFVRGARTGKIYLFIAGRAFVRDQTRTGRSPSFVVCLAERHRRADSGKARAVRLTVFRDFRLTPTRAASEWIY